MRTDRLRINQLSPKTDEWYLAYLQAVDTKNIEAYGTFLADVRSLLAKPPSGSNHTGHRYKCAAGIPLPQLDELPIGLLAAAVPILEFP